LAHHSLTLTHRKSRQREVCFRAIGGFLSVKLVLGRGYLIATIKGACARPLVARLDAFNY
jgi:hypothetical protein